jgi:D-specific alpha-keto acid dehydrogenase
MVLSKQAGFYCARKQAFEYIMAIRRRVDTMEKTRITIYGCEQDEADMFRRYSPHYGVEPAIHNTTISADNATLASGNRCISVNHKEKIDRSTLCALKENGVAYIATRSIGCNHIDIDAANKLGITIGNAAYSPVSVADYTLMLILMSIRQAKSVVCRADVHDYRLCTEPGRELRDMTVGGWGAGRIGQAVIDRLHGRSRAGRYCGEHASELLRIRKGK